MYITLHAVVRRYVIAWHEWTMTKIWNAIDCVMWILIKLRSLALIYLGKMFSSSLSTHSYRFGSFRDDPSLSILRSEIKIWRNILLIVFYWVQELHKFRFFDYLCFEICCDGQVLSASRSTCLRRLTDWNLEVVLKVLLNSPYHAFSPPVKCLQSNGCHSNVARGEFTIVWVYFLLLHVPVLDCVGLVSWMKTLIR